MKMKVINIDKRETLILLVIFCMFSCCKQEDVFLNNSILGEWFVSYSNNKFIVYETKEFLADGNYKQWGASSSIVDHVNSTYTGSYTYGEELSVIYSSQYSSFQNHSLYKVSKPDKYTLKLDDIQNSNSSTVYRRIVNTYTMKVGDNLPVVIDDPDFQPVTSHSCDESIAIVDSIGHIIALRRGTTFVRVMSSVSEVVIRIEVKDPNNVIDDFTKYIFSSIDTAIIDYGRNYLEFENNKGETYIEYYLIDNVFRKINFKYLLKDHVSQVYATFHDDVDIHTIKEFLEKKYEKLENESENISKYLVKKDNHDVIIELYEQYRDIYFKLNKNEFDIYEELMMLDIDRVAKYWGWQLDNSGQLMLFPDSNLFDIMVIDYDIDSRFINNLILLCRDNQSIDNVEEWYRQNYVHHIIPDVGVCYAPDRNFMRSAFYVCVHDIDFGEYFGDYMGVRSAILYYSHKKIYK